MSLKGIGSIPGKDVRHLRPGYTPSCPKMAHIPEGVGICLFLMGGKCGGKSLQNA
jgi:hypothetical protein